MHRYGSHQGKVKGLPHYPAPVKTFGVLCARIRIKGDPNEERKRAKGKVSNQRKKEKKSGGNERKIRDVGE